MLIAAPLLLVWVALIAIAASIYLSDDDDNQPPTACVTN